MMCNDDKLKQLPAVISHTERFKTEISFTSEYGTIESVFKNVRLPFLLWSLLKDYLKEDI